MTMLFANNFLPELEYFVSMIASSAMMMVSFVIRCDRCSTPNGLMEINKSMRLTKAKTGNIARRISTELSPPRILDIYSELEKT